jgi:hypothetical protein
VDQSDPLGYSEIVSISGLSSFVAFNASDLKAHAAPNILARYTTHAGSPQSTKTGTTQTQSGEPRTISPAEHGVQDFLVGLFIGFVISIIAWRVERYFEEHRRQDQPRVEWIWITVALIGAAGHIFFVDTKVGYAWEPVFDTTTLLWLTAAAAGLLYPRVSEITLGTFGVKLKDAVSDVSTLVTESLEITEKWALRLNDALVSFPSQAPSELSESVSKFLREAAKDAIDWFGKDGETRRLSYWLYAKDTDQLFIYLSNEIKREDNPDLYNRRLKKGQWLVGQALADDKPINLPDAPRAPNFGEIPDHPPKYRGMLIVAIPSGPRTDDRLGVICVDRWLREKFPDSSVKLIEALAAMTGMLLGEPTISRKLKAL